MPVATSSRRHRGSQAQTRQVCVLDHPRSARAPPPCGRGHSATAVVTDRPVVAFQLPAAAVVPTSRRGPVRPQTSPRGNQGAPASRPGQEPGRVYVTRKTGVRSPSLAARLPFYGTHEFGCPESPQDGLMSQALRMTISTRGNESCQLNGLEVWRQLSPPALRLRPALR